MSDYKLVKKELPPQEPRRLSMTQRIIRDLSIMPKGEWFMVELSHDSPHTRTVLFALRQKGYEARLVDGGLYVRS